MSRTRDLAREVMSAKEQAKELAHEIRMKEEALMEALINEGRVDCLSINWTRLKRL